MPALDEALDERDHLGDLLRGARAHVGVHDPEAVHGVDERVSVERRDLGGRLALLVGALDDLVVDVGDVLDERHLVAAEGEVAARNVEGEKRTRIADVDVVVDGRATRIHRDLSLFAGPELLFAARLRVENLHACSLVHIVMRRKSAALQLVCWLVGILTGKKRDGLGAHALAPALVAEVLGRGRLHADALDGNVEGACDVRAHLLAIR